ncbi:sigma-70 family RNA polymerase sigma factor [Oscillospiraceae bacterium CM]|nr:sigma-70 family RNA polymerase sigma factor [Clostridia bacterium]UOO37976.1 sigma-70 family RNA polymerase sigma factor [Oscillospiraceae bacterium CM]
MGFNNAAERKKFEQRWAILRKKYRKAGMSKENIDTLYEFDSAAFLSERRYRERTQPLPTESISEDEDEMSGLFKKFDLLKVSFSESDFSGRHSWIETVYDCELFSKLSALSSEDVELLTLYVFDEYTQSEIATRIGISQRGVGKRIERIKRFLK